MKKGQSRRDTVYDPGALLVSDAQRDTQTLRHPSVPHPVPVDQGQGGLSYLDKDGGFRSNRKRKERIRVVVSK